MPRPSTTLPFEDIAEVLRNTRGRIATLGTIAVRLERGQSIVRRAVERMVEAGMIDLVPTPVGDKFRLLRWETLEGAVEPFETMTVEARQSREASRAEADDDDDGEDADVGADAGAEDIWRARMGSDRWRDDPRAVAERPRDLSLQPPFLNQLPRRV